MAVDEFGREVPAAGASSDRGASSRHRREGGHHGPPSYHSSSSRHYHGGRSSPSPPSYYGRSSRKERTSSRSTRSDRPPPKSRRAHPSERYVEEPMLCEYVWKNQQQQQQPQPTLDFEKEEEEEENVDDDNKEESENKQQPQNNDEKNTTEATYDEYRRQYCLHYVRAFFNQHMDDSWFRSRYSPLGRKYAALAEQQRAHLEAAAIRDAIVASLEETTVPCSFVKNASLSGGVKPTTTATTTGLRKRRLDESSSSDGLNAIPKSHVLSIASQVVPIFDVPSYCTDEQLMQTLMDHCTVDYEGTGVQLFSTNVTESRLYRTCYALFVNEQVRADVLSSLTTEARRKAFPMSKTDEAVTTASAQEQQLHVPRKEDAATTTMKELEVEVECSDPYGRTEIDDDGKGGAPEDGAGVPRRRTTVYVQTTPPAQPIQVLSAGLSSRKRIGRDKDAAIMLARALDVSKGIPKENRLDVLLELLFDEDQNEESMLDVSIAYLRRVHLFSFYNGCTFSKNVGDVLAGHHATSTIHLRLENADEILDKPLQTEQPQVDDTTKQPPNDTTTSADMLVQRLDDSISKAMEACNEWVTQAGPVDADTEAKASEIEQSEKDVKMHWIDQHALVDEDGKARCAFHFCRKLFKDTTFLRKHLVKKHCEFLRAEEAKCHDKYMMEAWDQEESRPVPRILVDCGSRLGLQESTVTGAEPTAIDPEPELWRKQEENLKRQREEQQRRQEEREGPPRRGPSDFDEHPVSSAPSRSPNFVDVDDMKEEKVEMAFDKVDVPVQPPKKKKKKKKLL